MLPAYMSDFAAKPDPRGLKRYLRKHYPILNPLRSPEDDALLDDIYMVKVAFLYSGSPGSVARQTLNGVILDVKTTKYGRSVAIETDSLPFAKWIDVNCVQFPQTKMPRTEAQSI